MESQWGNKGSRSLKLPRRRSGPRIRFKAKLSRLSILILALKEAIVVHNVGSPRRLRGFEPLHLWCCIGK